MSNNLTYKSIFVGLLIISGLFISIYSGVIFTILAILKLDIPESHSYLAWVSNSYTLTLNILIIGLGILIGSLIYNRVNPSEEFFTKIKEGMFKKNLRSFRITIKTGSFFGALLTSYMSGYFISFTILFNIYNFSAVEIADLFLIPLIICIFFFQLGIFIFSVGLYFIKKFIRTQKSDTATKLPRNLSPGNRILSSVGIVYSSILIFIFGSGIYLVFLLHWHWFIGFYPPSPYTWEYMGFIFGVLSVFLFILIYGIQYYFRLNWYVKRHSEITRMKFKISKKFIAPIFAVISLIIMFLPFPPYLYIILYLVFIIS
ncbi:MAG: hypothetical protein ACFFE5_08325, partial [Candidatus Thorarchaeota archaeon]